MHTCFGFEYNLDIPATLLVNTRFLAPQLLIEDLPEAASIKRLILLLQEKDVCKKILQ